MKRAFPLLMILGLAGCSATAARQQPVPLPHTIGKIGPVELIVDKSGPELSLMARCAEDGTYHLIKIEKSVTQPDGTGRVSTSETPPDAAPLQCKKGDELLGMSGDASLLTGSTLAVTLTVGLDSSSLASAPQTFVQDENGALLQR